uniref:sensor histidine kinase n=1 Tax=Sporosarcina saromensis TaxID=359365 RepID=UPI00295F5696|nr:sensor histidine kinase [Sporosarcina saromensis]
MSGWRAVMGYCALLLFLISYIRLYKSESVKQDTVWLVSLVSLVVVFTVFYNPYNLLLGFFASNFIGWFEEKRQFTRAVSLFASVLIACTVWIVFVHGFNELLFFLPFLVVMILSPYGIRSMMLRLELEEQLNQANKQIKTLIKQEERVRIARDLHDTLGHTLSLITLQSQVIQRVAANPEKVIKEAEEIERTSRSAMKQVRELVANMRVSSIEEELVHMEQILSAGNVQFHFEYIETLPQLSALQQNILGLCIREASTNIIKHSQASNCKVTIEHCDSRCQVRISDNGVGMSDKVWGNGLTGMLERLALIEGNLEITTDKGTTLQMTIPIVVKVDEGAVVL